jgi:3-dehydroquinate synthase
MKIVTVDLGSHDYDIFIGPGLLYRIQDFIPFDIEERSFFIITDVSVQKYAASIQTILRSNGAGRCEMLALPSGEATKSFSFYQQCCEWLLSQGAARDSAIVAVGGGVIGDLAGFAASSVMRGIPFIQVPTTLLAQVDSSVGGKTGINTPQGKNLVGAFYQPSAVIADIETLKTLPPRELLAGYAEIAKYGLLGDAGFYEWLEQNGRNVVELKPDALMQAIETSVKAKAAIVMADEREKGRRALLNLGHTFGHALEAAAGYDGRLLHGEAVAMGMVMAFDLSARMGLCSAAEAERVEVHLASVGLPTRAAFIAPALAINAQGLMDLMKSDKKVQANAINFIVPRKIGDSFMTNQVMPEMVRAVLEQSLGNADQDTNEKIRGRWAAAFSSLSAQG